MRLVTFQDIEDRATVGAVIDGYIYALQEIWSGFASHNSMRGLLAEEDWRDKLESALGEFSPKRESEYLYESVKLRAPILEPSKVIAVGANTWSHLREADELTSSTPPQRPLLIMKAPSSVIGPGDSIVRPEDSSQVDYEVELGVIIGTIARDVSLENALEYVAGFTVANDVTARDFQLGDKGSQLYVQHDWAKSCDTFFPSGPALITPDEVGPIGELQLTTKLNGEVVQDGSGSDFIFSIEEVISFISRTITLLPGDVILSGSPAGVGFFRDPPRFLQAGDIVECSVSGIGTISNSVIDKSSLAQ